MQCEVLIGWRSTRICGSEGAMPCMSGITGATVAWTLSAYHNSHVVIQSCDAPAWLLHLNLSGEAIRACWHERQHPQ